MFARFCMHFLLNFPTLAGSRGCSMAIMACLCLQLRCLLSKFTLTIRMQTIIWGLVYKVGSSGLEEPDTP